MTTSQYDSSAFLPFYLFLQFEYFATIAEFLFEGVDVICGYTIKVCVNESTDTVKAPGKAKIVPAQ